MSLGRLWLNKHPDSVVVCGGDLNQLDLQHLEALSSWNALVDILTRGDSHLYNCLKNRPDLFERCYPIQILIKTDQKGVVLPARNKLRPLRRKVTIRDSREHRKQALYLALSPEDWSELLSSTNVDASVSQLKAKLITLMDTCLPLKTVTMSSRDPTWMSCLVKTLLKKKTRLSCNNKEQLATINRRISQLICENRTHLAAPVGSGGWWKTVEDITQRRTHSNSVVLDNTFANQLNDYFNELCTDLNYTAPVDVVIGSEIEVHEIPERLVWKSLSNIKQTITGPDSIPFWVWREHAEILTPILGHIWNFSLRAHTWPNINPIPKIDIPKEESDHRGINIIPVIARAFEKAVHYIHTEIYASKSIEIKIVSSR